MDIMQIIPLIGASWGVLFIFFLVASNRIMTNNRKAKFILILILLFNTHYLVDAFLNYNQSADLYWVGFSYFYFHLLGYWVLLFTSLLLKLKKVPHIITYGALAITVIRAGLIWYFYYEIKSVDEMMENIVYIIFDYYLVLLLNIIPMVRLYQKIKNLNFAVKLDEKKQNEFLWIKYLIIGLIVFLALTFAYSIFALSMGKEWLLVNDYESLFMTILLFVFAYFSIKFPVFAVHGDYKDIEQTEAKKYAKSSLSDEKSEKLWEKIQEVMKAEKLYTNPEFRLNNLADATGESLHHISQVINEKEGKSFFDFVNSYRIADAKELLISEKGQQFTILAVAFEVGFNSKNPFYNAFKKETGMTPSEFKKMKS
ncbi:helix-turn-helix domain-containing protein [uncultured Draconibacterium sp.]|uniref:AraC family transcriptional regulator n=1 Tax=uncultured Draconibacterium sp. TaxID=1573823 RepID=UPI0025F3A332|nr:helix-turn-helix domain-containing protein [uncultured Draconibacterium sp.]